MFYQDALESFLCHESNASNGLRFLLRNIPPPPREKKEMLTPQGMFYANEPATRLPVRVDVGAVASVNTVVHEIIHVLTLLYSNDEEDTHINTEEGSERPKRLDENVCSCPS